MQFSGGTITISNIACARSHYNGMQFEELWSIGVGQERLRQLRKCATRHSRRCFVYHLAETVDIRPDRAGAFRRDVSFGPYISRGLAPSGEVGHQSNVHKLGAAMGENDIRGFNIPVNQAMLV